MNIQINNITVSNDAPFTFSAASMSLKTSTLTLKACEQYVKVTDKLGIPLRVQSLFRQGKPFFHPLFPRCGFDEAYEDFSSGETRVQRSCDYRCSRALPMPTGCRSLRCHPAARLLGTPNRFGGGNGETGNVINIKSRNFSVRLQMKTLWRNSKKQATNKSFLCERGANFGYDNLVVDMLGFGVMKKRVTTCPSF